MVRHTDTDMTVMKEEVYIHRSLEAGGTACQAGPPGEAPVSVRSEEKAWG